MKPALRKSDARGGLDVNKNSTIHGSFDLNDFKRSSSSGAARDKALGDVRWLKNAAGGMSCHSDFVLAATALTSQQRQVRKVDTNALRRVGVELDEDWEHEQACGTCNAAWRAAIHA